MYRPIMPWGKHQGRPLDTIPTDYLLWIMRSCENMQEGLRQDIETELATRRRGASPGRSVRIPVGIAPEQCRDLIAAGRRALAQRYHPDRGGNPEAMKAVNNAADFLENLVGQTLTAGGAR